MVMLPDGEKTLRICNRLDSNWRVTDGQTDRQADRRTSCDGIVRAMHTRRAVKKLHRLYTLMGTCNVRDTSKTAKTSDAQQTSPHAPLQGAAT